MADTEDQGLFSVENRSTVTVTEWMRQTVDQVYHRQIGIPAQWSPEQTELFLSLVTQRLDDQAATLALSWGSRQCRAGPSSTTVSPTTRRRSACTRRPAERTRSDRAAEPVRLDSAATGGPRQQAAHTGRHSWTHRWRHLVYRAEPSEQIEELADHLAGPQRDVPSQGGVSAGNPAGRKPGDSHRPGHRLTHDLGVEVAEAMTAEGYPPE
jgi:hypothetical protein